MGVGFDHAGQVEWIEEYGKNGKVIKPTRYRRDGSCDSNRHMRKTSL
ncbi:DUF2963 domain-containing protein [Tumebacillus lacus]